MTHAQRRLPVAGWALLVAAVTLIAAVVEIAGQQAMRQGADHPQVEMARQAASQLNAGARPADVVGTGRADIATSLQPWLTVTDQHGVPLASSGVLGGLPPIPPSGVFDFVRAHGEDRISWQPAAGVRSAIAIDSYRGGFIVAGRSLRVVEDGESALLGWVVISWIAAMVVLGAGATVLQRRRAA